ncbi:response regulator transcription factor [Tumebacillus sp. ITR2]|uniref:Response regulator transcription factor n=1 Tax=Tumebacillus amylolyticus TaxID=2801339 RepID=A0ABS1JFX7_9BACL|nr:response regulator transcription factor [Tumebacillus amylolyticus]MBL0389130.1 response regulator transcription factor [Tumebacillus amylolyticus]
MESQTILVVDDEEDIRNLVEIYLRHEGYRVLTCSNGAEAIETLEREDVHLVILDIMMPGMDGIQTCMTMRNRYHLPVIMVSAKSSEMDKVHGLTAGADDYLSKPFHPMELVARVKSQLRRVMQFNPLMKQSYGASNQQEGEESLTVLGLLMHTASHEVFVEGRPVKLTPTEFAILELLVRNKGIVFSAERIYERVWKDKPFESDNTVMVHIFKLREKIEENPKKPLIVKTVWGVGYKVDRD